MIRVRCLLPSLNFTFVSLSEHPRSVLASMPTFAHSFLSDMRRLFCLFPLLVLCGCVTLQGRADELARKGQFVEAAAIYDQIIQDKPHDVSLITTRDELRWKALEQLLSQARQSRLLGDDEQAERHLEDFLSHRVRWRTKLNGALESSLLEEMAGTHQHCRQIIAAPAQRGLALTAEQAFDRKRALLAHPEMAPIRREMEGAVLRSGKSSCARLKQVSAEDAPHWAELVSRYCRRWHEDAPQPPPFPELLGAPSWTGSVEGVSPDQVAFIQGRLSKVFEASPWYSERSSRPVTFTLGGQFTTRFERDSVELTAPWVDEEPYTDHEERTKTYQEAYEDEEEYYEDGKKKTRKVTKYREKEYSYTVPVTKYRDVHKTFEYHAVRHSVTYRLSLVSTGTLLEQRSGLTASVTDQLSAYGYEHNVRFSPGDVSPQQPNLPASHEWFGQKVRQLEQAFAHQLAAHWHQAYCTTPALTLNEAARCARAGAELPAAARKVLSEVLGEDAPRTHLLFSSPILGN
jgi:2-oxo-4-hydroxy-4-carboxy--5-ureidoimidazoline (OHCU) decarboxylase